MISHARERSDFPTEKRPARSNSLVTFRWLFCTSDALLEFRFRNRKTLCFKQRLL
jgi:hypothetical protein